jgi:mannan endo-1,4-beta-mannosidase
MVHTRKTAWQIILAFTLVAGSAIAQTVPTPQNNPAASSLPASWPSAVNPHATPEARALLHVIDSISGHYTLTGQHNFPNSISRWTDRAYDLTGKYPALFGQDFGFSGGEDKDSVEARPEMIAEAERQYAHGAVIALTWHAVRPTDDEPVSFRDSVQGHLSDFEWHELMTPGTDLNQRWCAQVDVVAGYLRQLQDAHVPVLFRAYHEMNGNWFWWGGRPGQDGSAALYRQIYDRFVNLHHLHNIVWVWNVNTPSPNAGSIADYYPGPQYVDVLTIDIYGAFNAQYYTDMLALAAGKPIALGEVGTAPTPEILAAQPRWAYFMVWSNLLDFSNNVDALAALYHSPEVLTRDDSVIAAPMTAMRQATATRTQGGLEIQTITPDALEPAKSVLARLYGASSTGILSGQENTPQAVTEATTAVTRATAKTPAIYGEELGITSDSGQVPATARRTIVEEAKRENGHGAVIALTWHALRPTDDSPASDAKSVRGTLTDFEWDQLLTPGSGLNKRWCEQVDDVAETLRALQDAGIAVLWQPYPEANGKTYWWAGRKGIHGSAELYRDLFRRLVDHDRVRNLIWVWQPVAPGFGPNSPGPLNDYFPGLLYVDALAVSAQSIGNGRFRIDELLTRLGGGKPIGIELNATIPAPDFFTQQPDWAWFLASTPATTSQMQALETLYGGQRVVSLGTKR